MTVTRFALWCALCVGSAAGCDPQVRVDGVVRGMDGSPRRDVTVHLQCTTKPRISAFGATGADGRFAIRTHGCMDGSCTVTAAAGGVGTASVPVSPSCKSTSWLCGSECSVAEVSIALHLDERP